MRHKIAFARIYALSFLFLLLERLWNSFWPLLSAVAVFSAAALMRVTAMFGDAGHLAILAAFIASIIFSAKKLGAPFVFPRRADVERHIESASGLAHRPLEALQDKPVEGLSAEALLLWQKHQAQMLALRSRLEVYLPRPAVARQDRHALRHAAALLLFIGIFSAQGDIWPRLYDGLTPNAGAWIKLQPVAFDAWITPPDYTGKPPVFLATTQAGTVAATGDISVPEGSILKVRISGSRFTPELSYGDTDGVFTEDSPRNFLLEMPLTASANLDISQFFRSLGDWDITVTPDNAPRLSLLGAGPATRDALKITFQAEDDYGIKTMRGNLHLPAQETRPWIPVETEFEIPAPAPGQQDYAYTADLTSHPWAGMIVSLQLSATDEAGKTGSSNVIETLLPERKFQNPTAELLISERKRLMWFRDILTRRIISDRLSDLAANPGYYKGDGLVLLGLGMAARRLVYDGDEESVVSVINLLWDLALRIEDGGLSLAAKDLSDALQKLAEGLKDDTLTQEGLQELLDEVQQRMQEYFQAMAAEMEQRVKQGKNTRMPPPEIAQKLMEHIDMAELMKQMQNLTEGSEREQMQKMAEFLKNAIDSLDLNRLDEMREQQAQAMEQMQEMQDLIREQQALMDKTNRLQPDRKSEETQKEQEEIRKKLGDLMRRMSETMPELPKNCPNADQAMKESGQRLSAGDNKGSIPHQKRAIDELQQGLDDTLKQMAQGMKQMMLSFGFMPSGGGFGQGYDPLGREQGTPAQGTIKLPDEKERRRVQEIIRELRSRSNDYQRPQVEREYLDRLLDQFY